VNTEVNETRKMCSCSVQTVQTRGNRNVCIIIPQRRGSPRKDTLLHEILDIFFQPNSSRAVNGSDYVLFQMSFTGKMCFCFLLCNVISIVLTINMLSFIIELCCSLYCLCVYVYCTTATGCKLNCS